MELQAAGIVSGNVPGVVSITFTADFEGSGMTIKDIAKNCGVSVSTVSRVLNHHPDVSEEVRQRVLDEVERSSYIPNNSARDLVRSRSDAIGVIVRGTGNLFFSKVLKTLSSEIERYGYTMVLHFIGTDADEIKAGFDKIDNGVFGLIDWYARRMGIHDHEEAQKTSWLIVYQCMKIDHDYYICNKRLQEIQLNAIKQHRK